MTTPGEAPRPNSAAVRTAQPGRGQSHDPKACYCGHPPVQHYADGIPAGRPWTWLCADCDSEGRGQTCLGFRWIGQSLLCCNECGRPWFLHEGHAHYEGFFDPVVTVKPFSEQEQAEIPALLRAWEANAFWQRETQWVEKGVPRHVERQVGKDFQYPKGPTRPVTDGASTPQGCIHAPLACPTCTGCGSDDASGPTW